MRFYDSLSFEKNKKICMEKVVGEQDLALQQHFPYKSSKFSENSNCRINLLLNARGLKLGHFVIFNALFSISNILQSYNPQYKNFLGKIWSRDPSCKEPIECQTKTKQLAHHKDTPRKSSQPIKTQSKYGRG